jgi:hypothetical protein
MNAYYPTSNDRDDNALPVLIWLVIVQVIVLLSIYFWLEYRLYNTVIALIPGLKSTYDPLILIFGTYPIVPILMSTIAWAAMLFQRYTLTLIATLLMVFPALAVILWVVGRTLPF